MTRLAIVADVHADDYGSKVDPESGLNARWVDSLAMLRWVASDARERGADVLIVAGDLTEARHPAPWRVAQIGEALAAFKGPTKLLRGNHDGERDGRSIVDVLAAARPGWGGYTGPGVTVVGDVAVAMLPFLSSRYLRAQPGFEAASVDDVRDALDECYVNLARGLYVQASDLAPARVLVIHQGLRDAKVSDTQLASMRSHDLWISPAALGAIGFDAIVAGHFHKHQVLSTDPLIAYAGSPYRTDFGEEHQAKGYLIVDVVPGTRGAWEFVETPARRFVTIRNEELEAATDDDVAGAVVRVLDLDPSYDVAEVRRELERLGAFDVQEIRRRPIAAPTVAGGLSEGLTPQEALVEYFAGEDDAEPVVERGRGILEAVA